MPILRALFGDFQHAIVVDVLVKIARYECLLDNSIPNAFINFLTATELFEFVVMVIANLFGAIAE